MVAADGRRANAEQDDRYEQTPHAHQTAHVLWSPFGAQPKGILPRPVCFGGLFIFLVGSVFSLLFGFCLADVDCLVGMCLRRLVQESPAPVELI